MTDGVQNYSSIKKFATSFVILVAAAFIIEHWRSASPVSAHGLTRASPQETTTFS
jgi:hypothetical protein